MHQSRVTLAEENGYQSGHMSWIMIMGKEISRYSPKEGFLCSYLIPIYIYIFFFIILIPFQRYVIMGQDYYCLFFLFLLLLGASQTKLSRLL